MESNTTHYGVNKLTCVKLPLSWVRIGQRTCHIRVPKEGRVGTRRLRVRWCKEGRGWFIFAGVGFLCYSCKVKVLAQHIEKYSAGKVSPHDEIVKMAQYQFDKQSLWAWQLENRCPVKGCREETYSSNGFYYPYCHHHVDSFKAEKIMFNVLLVLKRLDIRIPRDVLKIIRKYIYINQLPGPYNKLLRRDLRRRYKLDSKMLLEHSREYKNEM